MKKTFSIQEAFSYGYNTVKKDWWFFIATTFLVIFFSQWMSFWVKQLLPSVFPSLHKDSLQMVVNIFQLIGLVFSIITEIGMASVYLDIVKGKKRKINDIFSTNGMVKEYIGLILVLGAYSIIGFFLFIIPGIIVILMYQFSLYFLLEQRKGSTDAMNKSQKITKGNRWKLLLFNIISMVLQVAGNVFFGVGYLLVAPIIKIAHIHIYKKLSA